MDGKDIKLILGSSVREHRKFLNLTQEKLAEIIGVDKNTINRIETGITFITSDNYAKLCNVFNVHPGVLMSKHQDILLKNHINYRTKINYLLQILPENKLVDVYNIVEAISKNS